MVKSIRNKLLAILCIGVMILGIVAPSFMNTAKAANKTTKTIYVDVEKNITGQELILKPVEVTLDDTATILDATKQAISNGNVDYLGSYIQAFKDSTSAFTYPFTYELNKVTNGVVYRTDLINQPIIDDPEWLREKEYTGISGWMFTVNNTLNDSKGTYYTAGTKLSQLPDDAVIRWEFTMAMGADLGLNSAYLPTEVTTSGYYNWGTAAQTSPFFVRADKTDLIRAIAKYNNKEDEAYNDALEVLSILQSDQSDVDEALAGLK